MEEKREERKEKAPLRRRVVAISKCQDCPEYECSLRQLAGTIPEECGLPEEKEYVRKALVDSFNKVDTRALNLEHQSRGYGRNGRNGRDGHGDPGNGVK
ncbi:MAG TPA: hypothetical protein PL124_10790 [Candidatus Cloacimonadota bacterium]|nr:hypothetical protein [Candidatus Cloacimonadota bacterium]HPS39890.1 hypothetical protein [Candidatus Cloacimonadota bacterium]